MSKNTTRYITSLNSILYLLLLFSLVFNGCTVYVTLLLTTTLGAIGFWIPFSTLIVIVILGILHSHSDLSRMLLFLKSSKPYRTIYSILAFIASSLILLVNTSILQSIITCYTHSIISYLILALTIILLAYVVRFREGIYTIILSSLIQIVLLIVLLMLTLSYIGGYRGLLYRVANVMVNIFWPVSIYPLYLLVLSLSTLFYLESWSIRSRIEVAKTSRLGFIVFIFGLVYSIILVYVGLTLSPYVVGSETPLLMILSIKFYSSSLLAFLASIVLGLSSLCILAYSITALHDILSQLIKASNMWTVRNSLYLAYIVMLSLVSFLFKISILIDILVYYSPIVVIVGVILTLTYKLFKDREKYMIAYITLCTAIYIVQLILLGSISISCLFSVVISLILVYFNPLRVLK